METEQRSTRLVTIFGGSGFIGRHLVRALAQRRYRIRVAVRRPDLAGHLQPLGTVGQIQAVQANLRYPDSVARALLGADIAVNLVGIAYKAGKQTFDAVQAQGAGAVAEAVRAAGLTRLVHVSAIGADPDSPSAYARSKAAGEAAVFDAMPDAVVIRPSIVFGPEDTFFNRFASMTRFTPFLPLIGGGRALLQPVFVGDVAEAIARAVDGSGSGGTVYELGGPEAKSLRDWLAYIIAQTGRRRPLLPVPASLARAGAGLLQFLPQPLLTVDQVTQLQLDNIVSATATAEGRTLDGFGIVPTAAEAIVPSYMIRFRPYGQFNDERIV